MHKMFANRHENPTEEEEEDLEHGPFLNTGSCVFLCSCVPVKRHQSQPKYCSNTKFTFPQERIKFPDVFSNRPLYRGCSGW